MEEVMFFLKEWIDSYVVSKELTVDKTKYIYEKNRVYMKFDNCYILIMQYQDKLSFDICVNGSEYFLLKELDKIINGFALSIGNKKKYIYKDVYKDIYKDEYCYNYYFTLTLRSVFEATELLKTLK